MTDRMERLEALDATITDARMQAALLAADDTVSGLEAGTLRLVADNLRLSAALVAGIASSAEAAEQLPVDWCGECRRQTFHRDGQCTALDHAFQRAGVVALCLVGRNESTA